MGVGGGSDWAGGVGGGGGVEVVVASRDFVGKTAWRTMTERTEKFSSVQSSVQFSSAQDGTHALGKAHMRSTPFLRSFPNVAFETVPMFV